MTELKNDRISLTLPTYEVDSLLMDVEELVKEVKELRKEVTILEERIRALEWKLEGSVKKYHWLRTTQRWSLELPSKYLETK